MGVRRHRQDETGPREDRGRGRGPRSRARRHARRRPVGSRGGPRRPHPRLGRHQGLDHPWGIAFLPDGGMLVTERPGRLRVDQQRRARPDADRSAAADAGDGPRRSARRRAASAVCGEPADLSHLLEAGPEGPGQRDDGGAARALGRRLDADRRQGHPRRRCLPRRTGHRRRALGPASGSYGSRLACDRDGLLYVSLGDRNYPPEVAGPGVAHRQDPADQRRRQRAAGQPVRGQGRATSRRSTRSAIAIRSASRSIR